VTRLSLKGLMAHKLRVALTALAIVLGTAMISGTLVITHQITSAFSTIFKNAYQNTDVFVQKRAPFGGNLAPGGPLPESIIGRIGAVPGVAKAEGQIQAQGALVVNGKYLNSQGGAPSLVISASGRPFATDDFVSGHSPNAHGQVAVMTSFADKHHLHVGQRAQLSTLHGVVPVTISGIFNYGASSSLGGATIVVTTFPDAQRWYNRVNLTSVVLVDGQPGISPETLKRRIEAAVPHNVKVQTGSEAAKSQTDAISNAINGFLTPFLLAFSGVAVLVGAFIIFNTFSITVAQRMRELAMLRTIGATRRQVLRTILGEAVVIGVSASLLGFVGGLGLAKLLNWLFDRAGFGIPLSNIQITVAAVVAPLVTGIAITILAAMVPAVRATRVPPVAALREGATLPPSRFAPLVPYAAGLFLVGGFGAVVYGVFGGLGTTWLLTLLAAGSVLVFIGVAMIARYLVPGLTRVIGWPIALVARAPGRLARDNAMRNPGRTAATAAALMIGIGLVVFVAVFANGFDQTFLGAIDRSVTSDLVITGQTQQQPVPNGVVPAAKGVQGVADVSGIGVDQTKIGNGGEDFMNAVDPSNIASVYHFDWQKGGSNALLGRLAPNTALVEEQFAKSHHLSPGDTFTVTGTNGRRATLREIGQYKDPVLFAGYVVSQATFRKLAIAPQPSVVLIRYAPNPRASTEDAVKAALNRYPDAKVQTIAEYKKGVEAQINTFLYLMYALLAISVIISLVGIVNTLALSVFERTREIGMLRAVGTTRRQMRRMIRYESVITAIIGGILGAVVGIVIAYIVYLGLRDQGIVFAVPVGQVIACLVVAGIAGVLAAVLPARRASRLNVLQALQYE
jgi:putative ABC transport system permease protein